MPRADGPADGLDRRRVLVVEDEHDIAALIAYQLTREGFRVQTVDSGIEALDQVRRQAPDLVVLDLMLPELAGEEVLREMRSDPATAAIPVVILTARREQEDRIQGLELGADDYVTKPFSPRELALRVRSILRRLEERPVGAAEVLQVGPVRMDLSAHRVFAGGEEVDLTPMEFRLLYTLMDRRGRTQSRRQLLEEVWDFETSVSGRVETRTVDMHVRRLRTKLEPHDDWVETVRGFGYRFRSDREA